MTNPNDERMTKTKQHEWVKDLVANGVVGNVTTEVQ